jgi:hypothetical protein
MALVGLPIFDLYVQVKTQLGLIQSAQSNVVPVTEADAGHLSAERAHASTLLILISGTEMVANGPPAFAGGKSLHGCRRVFVRMTSFGAT